MPLTEFQHELLTALTGHHTGESYLAGGAALNFAPNSVRYSDDLDFFHDSIELVASTYADDRSALERNGYSLTIELSQPGFIRSIVSREENATRIDWAHDSAWRFMPLVHDPLGGFLLHPIDLATNKVLTLAGRDEPRDFVDVLFVHETIIPLGALIWAAVGKDTGFSPHSLLELLRRRGQYRAQEFARLALVAPFDPVANKAIWLAALERAASFVNSRPVTELGCLYYSAAQQKFVMPNDGDSDIKPHFGRPGGVVPRVSGV